MFAANALAADVWQSQMGMSMKGNVETNVAKWDEIFNKGDTASLAGFYASDRHTRSLLAQIVGIDLAGSESHCVS